ncbi:MAG: response regulator, partial [Pseudomonadota bacterium]|nr:response regulator [Pseudomonadota bacterium]
LDSQLGEGSRFTVTLPWQKQLETQLTPEEMQTADESSNATLDAQSPLILLADDNEASMKTYADFLKHLGYRVSMAADGLEAVTQAQQEPPALILMDVQMPRLDGLEATRRIRRQPQLKHIPIIALTALAMPGDKERCLDAGVNDYLSKPVSMRQLGKTVEQLLNRN